MFSVQCETCGAVIDQAGQWRCHQCASKDAPAAVAPGTGPYHRSTAAPLCVVGPGVVEVCDTANAAELAVQRLNLAWRFGRLVEESDAINNARASTREARTLIADARRGLASIRGIRASRRWRDWAMTFWGVATAAAFGYWSPTPDWWRIGLVAIAACMVCAIRCMALSSGAERDLSGVVEGKPE